MIVNVAGCGAMLKDYGHHWHDAAATARAEFAAKVKDISEFLDTWASCRPRARSAPRRRTTTPAISAMPRRFASAT